MSGASYTGTRRAVTGAVGTRVVIKRGPIEWRVVCRWCHRGGYRRRFFNIEQAQEHAIETRAARCGACDRRE